MTSEMIEFVWRELKADLNSLQKQVDEAKHVERALIADSIPAYTVANLPTAANGGLGNGTSYVTLAWASNGRKSGEGVGAGTGVLCVYQSSLGQWLRTSDYTQVVA